MYYISVVVPVLNEESLVGQLIESLDLELEKISTNNQIIIVDDGSIDRTWGEIVRKKENMPNLLGIRLSRNFGQHYAITAGLAETNSEWVVVMDGDFQDRPEVIHELLARALQGYEIVFVNRENRPEKTYYKVLQKIFYFTLNTLSGLNLDSRQANFSIISRNVVEGFNKYSENTRFYASTVKWLGFKRSEISASHGKRLNGKPSYTLRKRIRLAVDIILSFSERPLKLSVGLGVVTSLFAIISSLNLFWKAFTKGYTVLGWASVIISVMFFSGVILIVLGIIGLYLGKVFNEVKNRPLYLISERTKN